MNFKQKIANYRFGNIVSSELPEVAIQGLSEGYVSESLSILSKFSKHANTLELEYYLDKSLKDLYIDLSNSNDIVRELLDYYLDEILYTRISALKCLKIIVSEVLDKFDMWDENISEKDRSHFQNLYEISFEVENLYSREDEPYSEESRFFLAKAEESVCNELKGYVNVFKIVELQPEYPDGSAALFKFLGENMVYPMSAREQGIYGEIHCGFVIDREGYVTDVTIKKVILFQEIITKSFFRKTKKVVEIESNLEMEEEVKRVVSSIPKWKPGYQQGRPVRVSYTLPMKFKLG